MSDFLNFTGEVSKGNEGIPVLDTHVWYGDFKGGRERYQDGKIHGTEGRKGLLYSFYSKEMTNPLGMLRRSAISEGSKISRASSETLRRITNHSVNMPKEMVDEILLEYMDNLLGMGYEEEWRLKVLTSTVRGYSRKMEKVEKGDTLRNRDVASTATVRQWKKILGPSQLFRGAKKRGR